MAYIAKRKTSWLAQVRKKGFNKSACFKTKADAQQWAKFIEDEIESGAFDKTPDIPFSEIIRRYMIEETPKKLSAKKEAMHLSRLMEMPIGRISLRDLKEDDFRKWRDTRLTEVSSATVLREWSTIGNLLSIAQHEWQLIPRNYLKGVKKPKRPKPRFQRWAEEDIDKIVFISGFDWDVEPRTSTARVAMAFLFAIETAMRAGEIMGLTWEHVNFKTRVAHLPRTKNGWPRDVPLSTKAIKLLKILEKIKKENEPVFQLTTANLDALFRKIKKKALVEDLRFHDTRREALTRLAKKVDVMTLAKISGHRDLRILQNTYYAPDMTEVVDLLD